MLDREDLRDFARHPAWELVSVQLARLVAELERRAARCEAEEHDRERGRLEGAERAVAVLQAWIAAMGGPNEGGDRV